MTPRVISTVEPGTPVEDGVEDHAVEAELEGWFKTNLVDGIHNRVAASIFDAEFPELMARAKDDETTIIYWPHYREFGILVLDGGSSISTINFDPWSGKPLPKSLRDELFDALEQAGIDAPNEEVPEKFLTEAWWIERGL